MADGTEVGSIYYDLNLMTAAFDAQMAAAKAKADTFGSGLTSIGTKLNSMASAIMPFSIAAGAALALSVKSALNFDQTMELLHTQAGDTQKQVQQLTPMVQELAGQVGFSPTSLANALYHVASVGNGIWSVSKQMDILRIAAEGAKIGQADLNDTTYALTSAMSSQIEGTENAAKAMGILNAIVGAGDMHMQDLNGAISTGFLSTARAFGLSLQSVGAALATLTDNGEPATEAATRLRMTMALMGAPTEKAAKVLETIGLSSSQAMSSVAGMDSMLKQAGVSQVQLADDLHKPNGMMVALSDLKEHLEKAGLSSTAAAAVMSRAFGGGRSDAALMTLIQNLDRLDVKFGVIGKNAHNFGEDWAAQQQQAKQKMDEFRAEIEVLGVQLGNALLPTLESLAKQLGAVAMWFSHLSKWQKTALADFLLFVAVLGPVLKMASSLAKVLGFMAEAADWLAAKALPLLTDAFAAFGVAVDLSMWEVLAILAAIVAVGVGIYELIKHWQEVRNFFMHVWDGIKAHWLEVGVGLALALGPVGVAIDGIMVAADLLETHWKQIANFLVGVWDEIKSHVAIAATAIAIALGPVGVMIDMIAGAAILIIRNWDRLKSWFEQFGHDMHQWFVVDLTNQFDNIQNHLSNIPDDIAGYFNALPGKLDSIWQQIDSDAKQWWQDICDFIDGVPKDVSNAWDTIKSDADKTWQHVSDGFDTAWHTVSSKATYMNIATAMFNFDKSHITQWYRDIDGAWQDTEAAVKRWLKDIAHAIGHDISSWWDSMRDFFKTLPKKVSEEFDATTHAIGKWFTDRAHDISTALDSWWRAFKDWFKDLPTKISSEFDKTTKAIGKWFSDRAHDITTGLNNWWHNMQTWFSDLPHKFTQEMDKVGNALKTWFQQLPQKLLSSLTSSGHQMGGKHSQSFGEIWKNTGTIGKIAAYIVGGIIAAVVLVAVTIAVAFVQLGITAVKMLLKGMSMLRNDLTQWGRNAINWLANAMGSAMGWIANEGHNIWQTVMNALRGAGSWLYNAGRDVINGLIHGIQDMAGKVFSAVEGIGKTAVNKLKGVLKIFSPSQVFHEIGQYVGQGLANGIQSMATAVGNSTTNMANSSLNAITKQADKTVANLTDSVGKIKNLSGQAAQAVTGASGSGTGANITRFANVNFGNATFNFGNNSDIDYFMQKLGRNVQLTGQGLTALR